MLLVPHWLVVIVHGRQMYLLFNFSKWVCIYVEISRRSWSDCYWRW